MTLIAQTGGGIPPLRFRWMPATGLSSPDDSVTRACPKVTTVYSLLVTDSAGGQTSESVTVVVSQAAAPTITRSGDTLICSPASQYQWYLAGAPIPGETRQKLRIGASGTYSVRITDSLGCVAWRDYLIGAPITIRTNKPGSICRDSCVTLVAQTTGGLPPLRFRWIPATDLSNPNDSITRACPKTSTTYTILVTDSSGTQSAETITVVVTQPALPVITRSRDTLYCSNALTYQWQYQGIPLPGETRQWLRIIWDGRYTVVTTDSNGCSASTDITAGNAPLTLRIAPPPPVCHDSCVTLVAVGNGGSPPYRFSWSPQTGLSHPDSAITGACPPSTTVYTLRIQDSAGTIKTEIVTVTVYPAPAAPVIRQYGDTLVSSPALTYQWYRDGVALPGETRQLLLIGRTGRYTVRTVDSSGCPASSDTLRILTPLYQAALGLSCIDSMEYEPGTVLTLPIFVREFSAASPVVLQRATVSLHFQKHVLQPILDSTMVMVDGERIRRVEITTRVPRALAQGMLFELPLIVMLGDTVCTEIVLDSLVLHTDKDVRVELRDTLCRICVRVCREGGVRLYRSDAGVLLLQNRPNPFNASTVIEYQLQREGHARLDVFDTKGRQIATPADGYHAAGAHRVFFDAQFLPSGVYAAVLRTASDVRVMLMTILK
ncbi:MAG: hypothetical protein IPP94_04745 [Ignavibacteria bacterium]|nr:hypothetical protein [Ignavibacteria bacterium]